MEIDGNPAGTIYLNHGQITFAAGVLVSLDLSARLLGAPRLSAASRGAYRRARTGRTATSAPC